MQGKSGSRSGVLQWVVVLVVGVLVVTVVLGLNLIPRLSDGQKVLDAARPAFAAERLTGSPGRHRHHLRRTSTWPIRS